MDFPTFIKTVGSRPPTAVQLEIAKKKSENSTQITPPPPSLSLKYPMNQSPPDSSWFYFLSFLQTGAGQFGEGSKDLLKGVVGGAASSASKITDALDHVVRGAGALDSEPPADGSGGMESAKVTTSHAFLCVWVCVGVWVCVCMCVCTCVRACVCVDTVFFWGGAGVTFRGTGKNSLSSYISFIVC